MWRKLFGLITRYLPFSTRRSRRMSKYADWVELPYKWSDINYHHEDTHTEKTSISSKHRRRTL